MPIQGILCLTSRLYRLSGFTGGLTSNFGGTSIIALLGDLKAHSNGIAFS
jgi:hypothetical protein